MEGAERAKERNECKNYRRQKGTSLRLYGYKPHE